MWPTFTGDCSHLEWGLLGFILPGTQGFGQYLLFVLSVLLEWFMCSSARLCDKEVTGRKEDRDTKGRPCPAGGCIPGPTLERLHDSWHPRRQSTVLLTCASGEKNQKPTVQKCHMVLFSFSVITQEFKRNHYFDNLGQRTGAFRGKG